MSDFTIKVSEEELKTQVKEINNMLAIGKLLLASLSRVAKRIQDTQKSLVTMAASRAKKEELKQKQEAKKAKQEADAAAKAAAMSTASPAPGATPSPEPKVAGIFLRPKARGGGTWGRLEPLTQAEVFGFLLERDPDMLAEKQLEKWDPIGAKRAAGAAHALSLARSASRS